MSALHLVTMPKWGLSMEDGMVVAWHRQTGDVVAAGDELIDIETTKITNTIEAPASGVLRRILVETGTIAACGIPLAIIGPADLADEQVDLFVIEHNARSFTAGFDQASAKAEPVVRNLMVNGETIRIRYLDTGAGEDILVLIHGFGGDLENWMFNQPALAAQYRVIAIDLPGHGGSDKRVGDGSAGGLAATVATLLEDLAPGPIHLVAHSFGAMVAREIIARRPDRIATFVAIAPADLGRVERAYIDGFIGARRRSDLAAAIGLLFGNAALATRDMAEALLRYKRLDGVDAALRAIDRSNFAVTGPDPAAVALWQGIGTNGLIIWGAQDAVIPITGARTDFAGTALMVIDQAGHMPHLEKADRVNSAIAGHVASWRRQTVMDGQR